MHWTDEAFVLSARPYGEASLLVQLFTRERGRHAGLAKGGRGRRTRAAFEVGARVEAAWSARLAENLGALRCELLEGIAADVIEDAARLACLSSAAAVAEMALTEREAMPRAYEGFAGLVAALRDDRGWAETYVRWELDLLAELGFGLDLSACAATGATDGLAYVSPKSGRAVSAAAGAAWKEKLLPLPAFLLGGQAGPPAIADGAHLTGYFLARHVYEPQGRHLPPAREIWVERLQKAARTT
jgi:DNA repair protein RecO (recombination protein O)